MARDVACPTCKLELSSVCGFLKDQQHGLCPMCKIGEFATDELRQDLYRDLLMKYTSRDLPACKRCPLFGRCVTVFLQV